MVHTFDISNFDYQMKRIPSQRYMKSGRKDKNFTKLEIQGASRPSSKLIVNMFSLCTS